jgi:3-deoxy-D-arabino-heptulosonate 7-phosphate (DAHP) synthase class II
MALSLLALASSCSKHDSPGRTDVVSRLCQHIVQNRQKMIVDASQVEVVWSDGAILEFGTNFPVALQKLISEPTQYRDIRSVVAKLQTEKSPEWKSALVAGSSQGDRYATIRSTDGSVTTFVQSLYVEYLHERYPTAGIRIRGRLDPVLFLIGGEVRASVMPVKF